MTLFEPPDPPSPRRFDPPAANRRWKPPEAVARRGDPSTSWEAARTVTGIRATQTAVLDLFRRYGPMHDERLVDVAGDVGLPQSPSGLRTRRRELVDLGYLVDTGRRAVTASGRRTVVWGPANPA